MKSQVQEVAREAAEEIWTAFRNDSEHGADLQSIIEKHFSRALEAVRQGEEEKQEALGGTQSRETTQTVATQEAVIAAFRALYSSWLGATHREDMNAKMDALAAAIGLDPMTLKQLSAASTLRKTKLGGQDARSLKPFDTGVDVTVFSAMKAMPCPFCGSDYRLGTSWHEHGGGGTEKKLCWIECSNRDCGAALAIGEWSVEDAVMKWNTRAVGANLEKASEDCEYDREREWCDHCANTGSVNCFCGGDLRVCENNGEYPCPRCG